MTTWTMHNRLDSYLNELRLAELSETTISKYGRDIRSFLAKHHDRIDIDKLDVMAYKASLITKYKMSTANSYLISLNRYLTWCGCKELTAKPIRLQRKSNLENIISLQEYHAMLQHCLSFGKLRDYLLLRTLAGTGIRVSELRYITVQAAEKGYVEIYSKKKCRGVVLSHELSGWITTYCKQQNIEQGFIFQGRSPDTALQPKSVWKLLKRIARAADVDERKVYPHNLRHLFAKTYMQKIGNMLELADLMGHSSIETTRIYAVSSQAEKRDALDELGL